MSIGPALEAVRFEWVTFNDAFQADEYSGYPSAASEKEWAKLWDCEFGALKAGPTAVIDF